MITKFFRSPIVRIIIFTCVGIILVVDRSPSQQTTLMKSVISSGASEQSGGTIHLQGTVGQAVIHMSHNQTQVVYQGFWFTEPGKISGIHELLTDNNAEQFNLSNYPNPFSSTTTISYQLQEDTHLRLMVYDMSGKVVRVLIDELKQKGNYTAAWDGRDGSGNVLPSGYYFFGLQGYSSSNDAGSRGNNNTKMMIIIR